MLGVQTLGAEPMSEPENTTPSSEPGRMDEPLDGKVAARERRAAAFWKVFVSLFGVGLPLVALGVELVSHWCRETFLDPLPTLLHAFLVALVPLACGVPFIPMSQRFPRGVRVLTGMALTVSAVYSLVFLPLTPLALIGLLFYGLGLLALSPLLALIASIGTLRGIQKRGRSGKLLRLPPTIVGVLAATLLVLLPMVRPGIVYYYLQGASSSEHQQAVRSIQRLRLLHAEKAILQACTPKYGRRSEGSPLTLSFLFDDLSDEKAAAIYYRVTGTRCRSELVEDGDWFGGGRRTLRDFEQDGESADLSEHLRLVESRFDGSIDTNAALSYLEWTLVVHNSRSFQQEGRAEMTLPEGGVVSRVSLWVEGEPREAAFAETAQVKRAYEQVVSKRRDPLLVTQAGPGRIQLRFFPIPANGDMKIRIGVTAPLTLLSPERARLGLPRIEHRNFTLGETHHLWMEAKSPFGFKGTAAQLSGDKYRLDLALKTEDLRHAAAHLSFALPKAPTVTWTQDPLEPGSLVVQRLEKTQPSAPSRVFLVVDASQGQEPVLLALRQALAKFPSDVPLAILVAGDETKELMALSRLDPSKLEASRRKLEKLQVVGGADNVAALARAVTQASESNGSLVLWIHGSQPVTLAGTERLRQLMERSGHPVTLRTLSNATGKNLLLEELNDLPSWIPLDPTCGMENALSRLFVAWSKEPGVTLRRTKEPESALTLSSETQASDHLLRLWARDEVERLATTGQRPKAVQLAAAHKLVTVVSGAVVLESTEQYQNANLTPPGMDRVPSIPEPTLVIIVACALLGLFGYGLLLRSRRQCSVS